MKFTISVPMLLLVLLILTGCTAQTTSKDSNNQQTLDPLPPEEVFQKNCASCHGSNLEGFVGPNLQKIGSKYSQDEIIKMLQSRKRKDACLVTIS